MNLISAARPALFVGGVLEDVEVAAAGGRAEPLVRRQHGDAEVEAGVVLDRGQVAGGVPHHRGLPFEEGLAQRAPLDGALGHDAVLGRQRLPELQRLDDVGIVEIGGQPSPDISSLPFWIASAWNIQ
jgi:hypothetical protein